METSDLSSLVAQMVKNPPAMQETWVPSLLGGRFPGGGHGNPLQYSYLENGDSQTDRQTEEDGGLQSMGSQRVGHNQATKHTAHVNCLKNSK